MLKEQENEYAGSYFDTRTMTFVTPKSSKSKNVDEYVSNKGETVEITSGEFLISDENDLQVLKEKIGYLDRYYLKWVQANEINAFIKKSGSVWWLPIVSIYTRAYAGQSADLQGLDSIKDWDRVKRVAKKLDPSTKQRLKIG